VALCQAEIRYTQVTWRADHGWGNPFLEAKPSESKMTPEEPADGGGKAEPEAQGDEDRIGPVKIDQITDERGCHRRCFL
jgi:hypothetical protein